MRRNPYTVEYKMHEAAEVKRCYVIASNKEEAYYKAVYEEIPFAEDEIPYSAWVVSVTYNNGNCKRFKTFEGLPY